ncbi:MAG: hypothetical protein JNL81_10390 [Hyphomonadaceae bacterium]|nr:hypothetical protein [Hyphomonadaceae bacterium]
MRVAFGVVGLALAAVAIGACGDEHYKGGDAVSCMAYLTLQRVAIDQGRSIGDAASIDAANAAWRTLAEQKYTADELAQYFASSFAVFDDVEPIELQLLSSVCQAQAPAPSA